MIKTNILENTYVSKTNIEAAKKQLIFGVSEELHNFRNLPGKSPEIAWKVDMSTSIRGVAQSPFIATVFMACLRVKSSLPSTTLLGTEACNKKA